MRRNRLLQPGERDRGEKIDGVIAAVMFSAAVGMAFYMWGWL